MQRAAVASLCVAFLLGGAAFGQAPPPPGAAPVSVQAKAGTLAVLKATATGEVAWVFDERFLPPVAAYQDKAAKTLVLTSGSAATYYVSCVEYQTGKGFLRTDYLVVFTGGPAPPVPPGPDPPVPTPTFDEDLRRAYAAETDPKKGYYLSALTAVYRLGPTVANQAAIKSWKQLFDTMHAMAVNPIALPDDNVLLGVRKVIQTELRRVLPVKDGPLDQAGRELAGKTFERVGKVLEGVPR